MDMGTILGVIGIFLALSAIILHLIFRDFDRERTVKGIENRLETFNQTAGKLLGEGSTIIKEVREIRSASQHLRPELSIFLATQWRFIEKIFRYRFEKHSIARKIATKYIDNNTKLLLDSGSTTDLVTSELLVSRATGFHVYSNNVFAAMHLVGTTAVPFNLFQGRFSDRYAAVYSDEANSRFDQLGLNLFILAAVALTYDTGIMVHNNDTDNYNFKRAALQVFRRTPESKLLIAADASKFFEPLDRHKGIVTQSEWTDIISESAHRIVIVTSPPAPDFDPAKRAIVDQELNMFRSAGIEVDDSP